MSIKINMNILEKISKNEYLEKDINKHINSILDINLDTIKNDSTKGILLSILERASCITFSDIELLNIKKDNRRELYRLYTESKEIVVENRFNKFQCIEKLSEEFDLKISNSELTYFILLMYITGIKLNDTFPMIPGLYKQLLPLSDLSIWISKVDEYMSNHDTDWIELKDYKDKDKAISMALFEYKISYDSIHNILYKGFIKQSLNSTLYVSKENSKVVKYDERMIFSKYLNPTHEMIIIA